MRLLASALLCQYQLTASVNTKSMSSASMSAFEMYPCAFFVTISEICAFFT